jgi:glutathione synthase/RimK-type ligase-like ATP-grasp enzyme
MINRTNKFRPRIRSRHSTHDPLRDLLPRMSKRAFVRLGSTTPTPTDREYIEVNTVDAIRNSANKLLMKQCFHTAEVRTAQWWTISTFPQNPGTFSIHEAGNDHDNPPTDLNNLPYPIVAKHIFGSRGTGNYLIKSVGELQKWLPNKTLHNYIFEKYYSYNREYRLHVTQNGCFYTCRKLLREDTPADKRWFRNDSNSNWIVEENESFDKPVNWEAIVAESVKALNAVGLDFGAVDVKVQSASKEFKKKGTVVRDNPEFIIIEINSAPSFGVITLQRYLERIPVIINAKIIAKEEAEVI